jgi:hypothetical protein
MLMKNSKNLLLLAMAMISLLNNARDSNEDTLIVPFESTFTDVIILQPIDDERSEYNPHWAKLFEDCYRQNDVQACQKLGVLIAYKTLHERQNALETIHSQEKTIASLRDAIDVSTEREKRRAERKNKRHKQKKLCSKELVKQD